ncbi:MAG: CsgG/HfaB family protein [bacterium]
MNLVYMFNNKIKLRKLLFLSFLFFLFTEGNGYSAEVTLAVLDFENNSIFNAENYDPLEAGIAEMMISEFNTIESIKIVERQKLQVILDELKMSQSGLGHNQSLEAGRIVGADYLVFGSFIVTMENKIRIDTRIVEVETGLTLKAEEITGKTKKLLILIQKLGEKVLQGTDKKILENEKITFVKGQKLNIDAVIWFSKGIAYRDIEKYDQAKKCFTKALEIEPKYKQAKEEIKLLSNIQ